MSITLALTKLTIGSSIRAISTSTKQMVKITPILFAEPLKKKKKMDPAVIRAREERKRKKLEKQIRRLEKNARQLKPIDELEVPLTLLDEKDKRFRNTQISQETLEKRAILEKTWAKYKMNEKLQQFQKIDQILLVQQKALQELRYESEELFQAAIQPDPELVPIKVNGPVSTPPVEDFASPDGDYVDTSKKWD